GVRGVLHRRGVVRAIGYRRDRFGCSACRRHDGGREQRLIADRRLGPAARASLEQAASTATMPRRTSTRQWRALDVEPLQPSTPGSNANPSPTSARQTTSAGNRFVLRASSPSRSMLPLLSQALRARKLKLRRVISPEARCSDSSSKPTSRTQPSCRRKAKLRVVVVQLPALAQDRSETLNTRLGAMAGASARKSSKTGDGWRGTSALSTATRR